MNINDLGSCNTWVVAISGYTPLVARYNASRREWQWYRKIFRATAFPSREAAVRCPEGDAKMRDFLSRTVPPAEMSRVRPARVEMSLVFDEPEEET